MIDNELIATLNSNLPPLFTCKEVCQHLGGLFKANTLKNIDYQGLGPKGKQRIGRNVLYSRGYFVDWLNNYIKR
jgi:hypothetical protein